MEAEMNESRKLPPKKVKANGFWSFTTSVRAQLQLYNPAQAASAATHAQTIWELMSKDEKQEWEEFALEMEVRERLCPRYVVDIATEVRKQYDEDKKKKKVAAPSYATNANYAKREEPKNAPIAVVTNSESEYQRQNWSAIDEVGSKQPPIFESPKLPVFESPTSLDTHSGSRQSPEADLSQPPTPLKMTMRKSGSPTTTAKETSNGLDSLVGDGGLRQDSQSPRKTEIRTSPMGAATIQSLNQYNRQPYENTMQTPPKMAVQQPMHSVSSSTKPTVAATTIGVDYKVRVPSSGIGGGGQPKDQASPSSRFVVVEPKSNPWQRVVSTTPQSTVQQKNAKSSLFASRGSPMCRNVPPAVPPLAHFVTEAEPKSEPEQPQIESTNFHQNAGDADHAQECRQSFVCTKTASSTNELHRSSSASSLAKKRPPILSPSVRNKLSSPTLPETQRPQCEAPKEQQVEQRSPTAMMQQLQLDRKEPSAKSTMATSIPKSPSTLLSPVNRSSPKSPLLSSSPIPTPETRMLGFGRGANMRH